MHVDSMQNHMLTIITAEYLLPWRFSNIIGGMVMFIGCSISEVNIVLKEAQLCSCFEIHTTESILHFERHTVT